VLDVAIGAVTYCHADHLGTLRATSDDQSAVSGRMVLTAFGEVVCGVAGTWPCGLGLSPVSTRYQYAGDWGYESGLLPSIDLGGGNSIPGLPWQHVGHRWYDSATGRFLQRDPIGIGGGSNVYLYAQDNPAMWIDPLGLWTWERAFVGGFFSACAGGTRGGGPWGALIWGLAGFVISGYDPGDAQRLWDAYTRLMDRLAENLREGAEEAGISPSEFDNVPPPPWKGRCTRGCHREEWRERHPPIDPRDPRLPLE